MKEDCKTGDISMELITRREQVGKRRWKGEDWKFWG